MPRAKKAKATPPRLPRFSPSRIGLYLFCPRAYFLYYHRGLRWGGGSPGYALGGSLHRALQAFHDRGGAEVVSAEELVGQLHEKWSELGYASPEEEAAHRTAGESLLLQYHEAAAGDGRQTLWTERTVQQPYERFVLFGKIDRLDRRSDGSLEVVDYKSGRLTVTEEEVREDLALRIYQLLIARMNPGIPVHAGIYCLRGGESASVLRSAEELDEVERETVATVETILQDGALEARPGEQCRECVYPRVCPPGRQWLFRNRWSPLNPPS